MRRLKVDLWKAVLLTGLALFLISPVGSVLAQDGSCKYCGMKRAMFGHSWMVIEGEDGSKTGVCSIHCAAIDLALNIDRPVVMVTVGDYNTKDQIDAEKAYWVIGGDKMGVMTTRAKWAFKTKESAAAFIKDHGGRPATYDEAMKAAFEDMYQDTLMIQKKRKMKRMKMKGSHSK